MLICLLCEREPGLVYSSFPASRGMLTLVLLTDTVVNRKSKKKLHLWVSLAMSDGAVLAAEETLQLLRRIIEYGVWSMLYCSKTVSAGKKYILLDSIIISC